VSPDKVKKAYTPFISVYDTYLERFNNIVDWTCMDLQTY